MPLARSLALRYRGGIEAVEDLVQVACLGLLKALDRYDPARNVDFVAFAAPTILGELRHHFRDHSWTVRLPRGLQERSTRIDRGLASDPRRDRGGRRRSPTIARRAGLTETEVLEALYAERSRRPMSLDAATMRIEDDPTPLVETIGDRRTASFARIEDNLAAGDRAAAAAGAAGAPPALPRGPDPARDRRPDRDLADAGVADAQRRAAEAPGRRPRRRGAGRAGLGAARALAGPAALRHRSIRRRPGGTSASSAPGGSSRCGCGRDFRSAVAAIVAP